MNYSFEDDENNTILAVSTLIPGVILTPPRAHPFDAKHRTEKDLKKVVTKMRSDAIIKRQVKA